jgi:hypothetical protein
VNPWLSIAINILIAVIWLVSDRQIEKVISNTQGIQFEKDAVQHGEPTRKWRHVSIDAVCRKNTYTFCLKAGVPVHPDNVHCRG